MPQQDMITRSATHRASSPARSPRQTLTRRRPPRSCRGQELLRHRRTVPDTTRTHGPLSTVSPYAHNDRAWFRRRNHRLCNGRLNWRTGVAALLRHDVLWLRGRRADVDRNVPSSPRSRDQLSSTPQTPTATARRRKSSGRSFPTAVTRSSSARRSSTRPGRTSMQEAAPPTHHPRGRGQTEAAPHRLAGLLLRPRLRRAHANRADRTRPRRSPAEGQDPLPGRQQLGRLADRDRARHLGARRFSAVRADPAHVQPGQAAGGGRDPSPGRRGEAAAADVTDPCADQDRASRRSAGD